MKLSPNIPSSVGNPLYNPSNSSAQLHGSAGDKYEAAWKDLYVKAK